MEFDVLILLNKKEYKISDLDTLVRGKKITKKKSESVMDLSKEKLITQSEQRENIKTKSKSKSKSKSSQKSKAELQEKYKKLLIVDHLFAQPSCAFQQPDLLRGHEYC